MGTRRQNNQRCYCPHRVYCWKKLSLQQSSAMTFHIKILPDICKLQHFLLRADKRPFPACISLLQRLQKDSNLEHLPQGKDHPPGASSGSGPVGSHGRAAAVPWPGWGSQASIAMSRPKNWIRRTMSHHDGCWGSRRESQRLPSLRGRSSARYVLAHFKGCRSAQASALQGQRLHHPGGIPPLSLQKPHDQQSLFHPMFTIRKDKAMVVIFICSVTL